MTQLLLTAPERRLVYEVVMSGGYSNPHHHFRWQCGCGFKLEQCEDDPDPQTARIIAQDKADHHECPGWLVEIPEHAHVAQDGLEHRLGKPEVAVSTAAVSSIPLLTVIRRKHSKAGTIGTCSSCGAPVFWLVSAHDKLTPIDITPVGQKGNVAIDLEKGTWYHVASRPETPVGDRYVTHFVTCPNAAEHRKRG